MKLIETPLRDLFVLEPNVFRDERGYFFEAFNEAEFRRLGINIQFVQDNQSLSRYGTVLGLHFQMAPKSQAKLVSVAHGRVLDVAVDIRPSSPTFGKSYSTELSDENLRQMLIPHGFAHGFICLSETAVFTYKCDNLYSKELDSGIRFDDPDLGIEWPLPKEKLVLSEKDKKLPFLREIRNSL